MTTVSSVIGIIRGEMSSYKVPRAADKVYKDECVYSFDSPFSDSGLYVNLITWRSCGEDYLEHDMRSTNSKVYLHQKWFQLPKKTEENPGEAPIKLAIGVEGGFNVGESNYEIVKENTLVVAKGAGEFVRIPLPNNELPEFVSNVINGILEHAGMKSNMQVSTWNADQEKKVSKYAANLIQTNPTNKRISQDPKQWKDEATGATENLWLNLSTGYIGGGRKLWDGSGGSGSALQHYQQTGGLYPLVVKLGTITTQGADVYSYSPDEDDLVLDPKLADHLSFWGIDIMKLEKTDLTMGELEVAKNMTYDWSKIIGDEKDSLETVHGAGRKGLTNIGSSCYMNSVLQALLTLPEIQARYLHNHKHLVSTAPADATQDLPVQLSKIAVAVNSDRYTYKGPVTKNEKEDDSEWELIHNHNNSSGAGAAAGNGTNAASVLSNASVGSDGDNQQHNHVRRERDSAELEKYVVAPRMFKHLVGKNHPEFSSGRQQDVSEYFQYLLETLTRAERVHLPRITAGIPPSSTVSADRPTAAALFEYHLQYRYQCSVTGQVKYVQPGTQDTLGNLLDLPVPLEKAVPWIEQNPSESPAPKRAKTDNTEEAVSDPAPETFISFSDCLAAFFAPTSVDMVNPSLAAPGVAGLVPCAKTTAFASFPKYLMVKMARYYAGSDWVQRKITSRINVPEALDLSAYRVGHNASANEVLMPTHVPAVATVTGGAAPATAAAAPFVVSEELVTQLMGMGFSMNGCKRAAIATQNADAEIALNWIFEHMEDADFNDPPAEPETATPGSSEGNASGGAAAGPDYTAEAANLSEMLGYSAHQCNAALVATQGNVERAADWLFSHTDDLDAAVAEALALNNPAAAATGTGAAGGNTTAQQWAAQPGEDGTGRYTLRAMISHLGKNTDHGHYVVHIKKEDGAWYLFNDDKVGKLKGLPPLEFGFMYLYERDD